MKILVVDDSKVIRLSVGTYLKENGHSVTEAEDGQVALTLLKKMHGGFDLVITDLNMPFKTGLQLLDDMELDEELKKVPAVLYSRDSSSWLVRQVTSKGRFYADKGKGMADIEKALSSIAAGLKSSVT